MKVRDVIRILEADGWQLFVMRGSHRQFRHPTKAGKVTVAGHPSADVAVVTFNNIMKQAGLQEKK